MTYDEAVKKYGEVALNNLTVALCQDAYCDNYGTDGEVRYYASAMDQRGKDYKVTWATTAIWDKAQKDYGEYHRLREDSERSDEDDARLSELESIGAGSGWIEDESNACDWDNPVSIELL